MNRKTEQLLSLAPLRYWRIIRKWAAENHDLTQAELEFLIYLHPIEYFTVDDFRTGELMVGWNKKRFYSLIERGWIHKVFKNNRKGARNRYATTRQFRLLYNRIHRIISGENDLPESAARNKIMKRERYTDKVYSTLIKKFNEREHS